MLLFFYLCYAKQYSLQFPLGTLKFPFEYFCKTFVGLLYEVSVPYVRTDEIRWLYTILFSDSGRLLFITLCCLSKQLHSIFILLVIFFMNWTCNNFLCPVNVFLDIFYFFIIYFNFMVQYLNVEHHLCFLCIPFQTHFLTFFVQLQSPLLLFICRFVH